MAESCQNTELEQVAQWRHTFFARE